MKNLNIVGRLMYAIPMALFGIFHFMGAKDMVGYVPSYLPLPIFWVYLTGVGLLAAAIAFIIQKKARLAGLLLGIMLLVFALTIHLPALTGGDQSAMPSLLKDIALAGASFFIGAYSKD